MANMALRVIETERGAAKPQTRMAAQNAKAAKEVGICQGGFETRPRRLHSAPNQRIERFFVIITGSNFLLTATAGYSCSASFP